MVVKLIWISQVYRSLVCCLLFVAFVTAAATTGFELNETEEATNGVGPEINGTQEVSNLMDQLFNDNQVCSIPVMELGFLVSGSYDQPSGVGERDFRKALKFVKETAEHIKISDLGTHVGLVVYGKRPLMAFDFNEYFNIEKLSEAIEEVKTPDNGNNVGEALSFVKKQLFDKSARTGIPKALIVLLTKKSEDELQPGIDALREAGVNIFTVGIEAKTDPMEMNDIASDVKNTFFSDYDHLGSLVTKLAPQLCQAATEPDMHSNDENKQMKPEEEPGAATAHVNNVNVTYPGIPLQGKKETSMKEGPRTNKVDLVFLVESTGKMGVAKWKRTILFMKYVTNAFDVSSKRTKVGIVIEGRTFYIVADLNRIVREPLLMAVMGMIPLPYGDRKMGKRLKDLKELVIDTSGRPDVPHIVVVLTDGKAVDDTEKPAKLLRKDGAEIFAIGLGAEASPAQLEQIASFPASKYVYESNFKDIVKIASKVVAQIYNRHFCGGMDTLLRKLLRKHVTKVKKIPIKIPSRKLAKLAPQPRKETNDQGSKMAQNTTSDENNYQDSVSGSGSTDEDADSKESADEMSGTDSANSGSSSGDDSPTDDDNTRGNAEISIHTFDDSSEKNEDRPADSTLPAVSGGQIVTKERVKKTCFAKADIGILIDGSSSIKEETFFKLLNFTTSVVDSFSVSKDRTHIAVATASKGPQMSFDFQGFHDATGLKTAISRIAFHGGPYLLGSSLTGLKTTWFKNSGRTSIPQLLLVLATTSSGDDIVAPSRVLRDRGVRIESVGIGPHFDGTQLKEIATHPAKDHVMAVSKFELLPMIRPLLTFRMCRAVGGKLIQASSPEIHDDGQPGKSTSASSSKERIDPKAQHLPTIKLTQQDTEYRSKQETEAEEAYLESQMEQLEKQRQNESDDSYQKDEIEKAKVREGIRRKLYAWLRRLGGSKKDMRAAYRSFIFNINGHHDSVNCKDRHELCKQWARDNLCERENDTMDPQSVQRVCPRSCQICVR